MFLCSFRRMLSLLLITLLLASASGKPCGKCLYICVCVFNKYPQCPMGTRFQNGLLNTWLAGLENHWFCNDVLKCIQKSMCSPLQVNMAHQARWHYIYEIEPNMTVPDSHGHCSRFHVLLILQFVFCNCHFEMPCWSASKMFVIVIFLTTNHFPLIRQKNKKKQPTHLHFDTILQEQKNPTMSSSCHSARTSSGLWRRPEEPRIPASSWRSDSPAVITRPKSWFTSTDSKMICTMIFKGVVYIHYTH